MMAIGYTNLEFLMSSLRNSEFYIFGKSPSPPEAQHKKAQPGLKPKKVKPGSPEVRKFQTRHITNIPLLLNSSCLEYSTKFCIYFLYIGIPYTLSVIGDIGQILATLVSTIGGKLKPILSPIVDYFK